MTQHYAFFFKLLNQKMLFLFLVLFLLVGIELQDITHSP